jgi:hypothetical protein
VLFVSENRSNAHRENPYSLNHVNTDVSISVLLVNAMIFTVIGILREDPLSMGMLDVFFSKIPIMCLFY